VPFRGERHTVRLVTRLVSGVVVVVVVVSVGTACSAHRVQEITCPGAAAVAQHHDVDLPLMCPELVAPKSIRYIYTGGPGCVLVRQVEVSSGQSVMVKLADAGSCRASLVVGPKMLALPNAVPDGEPITLTVHYISHRATIDYKTAVTRR
jgi:hypothetical protein